MSNDSRHIPGEASDIKKRFSTVKECHISIRIHNTRCYLNASSSLALSCFISSYPLKITNEL